MRAAASLPAVALSLLGSCAGTRPSAEPPAASASDLLAAGEERLASGDLEGALSALEKSVVLEPQSARSWALLAVASERFAEASSGATRELSLEDARRAFGEASRRGPSDPGPRLGLGRLALRGSAFEIACERAIEARALSGAAGDAPSRFEANRLLAEACLGKWRSLPPGGTDPATAAWILESLSEAARACLEIAPERPDGYALAAEAAQSRGDVAGARQTLGAGVRACPEDAALHERLQRALLQEGSAEDSLRAYETLARERPESPTTVWYLGLARLHAADEKRRAENWDGAGALYDGAVEAFESSARSRPEFRDSGEHYAALALASKGWCRMGARDLEAASRLLTLSLARRPAALEARDGLGRTPREAADAIGEALRKAGEEARARTFFADLVASCPEEANWLNNLAFLCRETGRSAEAAGRREEARELYESSLAAYEKALALAPDDPRLLNDGGLVLLYHLDREHDRAESLFRRAVERGEAALEDSETPEARREGLDEAVGDAYQNLGVLYYEKRRDPPAAKAFFERSLRHAPKPRPRVRWYLSKIEEAAAAQDGRTGGEG